MSENEIWKDIPGYERYYQASTLGRVRSIRLRNGVSDKERPTPLILKTRAYKHGYHQLTLGTGNSMASYRLHRLIALTFHGPCPEECECLHINGNPSDNRAENLRWGTKKENSHDKVIHGVKRVGEQVAHAKLTDDEVLKIKIRIFRNENYREIAKDYGVSHQTIFSIKNWHNWTHLDPVKILEARIQELEAANRAFIKAIEAIEKHCECDLLCDCSSDIEEMAREALAKAGVECHDTREAEKDREFDERVALGYFV